MDDEVLDVTKLKYVLYARKSTDDPDRQAQSIPEQIDECEELAQRLHLNVVKPYLREEKSAKKPHLRKVFDTMLKDIRAGKYDAILAWNPDRLARNMLEAGILIQMVDEGVIKDLKFVTHVYSHDANGKMLLGMAFVLSKQYSDKLSQDVTRGVRGRAEKGKTPTPKYGYINDEGIYRPDNQDECRNFDLMCGAWQMRKKGDSIEKISDYLNGEGFYRVIKKSGNKLFVDPQKLSDIFKDSFYYGVLNQAKQQVDLRELYDFEAAVSEDDWNMVQSLSYRKIKPSKPHKLAFYPLRLMVLCSYCGMSMRVGPSKRGSGVYRLHYRCDNKQCIRNSEENRSKRLGDLTRIKVSVRGKVLFDFIYQFLEDGLNFTEAEYKKYYEGISHLTDQKREKIRTELNSRRGALKAVKREISELSLASIKHKEGDRMYTEIKGKVEELEQQEQELTKSISGLEEKLSDPEKDKLSLEQFLNLSKNAVRIVKSPIPEVKDQICRLIFLNLTIDDKNVLSYQLKPPFDALLKHRHLLPSRGGGN